MPRTITVKGVGTASTKPDQIVISLNISAKAKEYSLSVDNANERIARLQSAVGSVGFAKEALKTLSFNVRTDYESYHDKNGEYRKRFMGYVCDYRLKLAFDMDAKRLAETLDAISSSKADAQLSISFTVKNPGRISDELLRSAAEDARRKAEILCAASGVKLGDLLSVDYNWGEITFVSESNYAMMDALYYAGPKAAAPEFEPEDIESRDTAAFVWEII
ncbi:MAG: SIMPL domain-containing protein [Lachnospiraceae bacterium]|nr:SIMPL domain-containing protein [Ruminococcus sp.]MCM1275055.1 SIMPL domain-containing protein [Lachnospiraceae bacterium]